MTRITACCAITALVAGASVAHAEMVTATITADNHYSLYTDSDGMVLLGGNETGVGGAPGTYNWSEAETYIFEAGQTIYIAAWSDDSVAQGLLADITVGANTLHSGNPAWEVYSTGLNRDDGDPHPTAVEISGHVAAADLALAWEVPFVGSGNGLAPWGTIAGIGADPKWMWRALASGGDPLQGGADHGEYLIFRTVVPTPGSLALAGLGGVVTLGRRRR